MKLLCRRLDIVRGPGNNLYPDARHRDLFYANANSTSGSQSPNTALKRSSLCFVVWDVDARGCGGKNRTGRRSKYIGEGFSSSLLYDVQMVDEAFRRRLSVTLKGARA